MKKHFVKKHYLKALVVVFLLSLVGSYFYFGLGQYLNFSFLKEQKGWLEGYAATYPFRIRWIYFLVYVILIATSIPGALILTLAGGFLFGFWEGFLLISFASTWGSCLAFFVSRFLFRDFVAKYFQKYMVRINEGVEKDGFLYLLTLRLIPVIPLFVLNICAGVTRLKLGAFYVASQIGMAPGTLVYVHAGKQLSFIESPSDIVRPQLLFAFFLLASFPFLMKKLVTFFTAGKNICL